MKFRTGLIQNGWQEAELRAVTTPAPPPSD